MRKKKLCPHCKTGEDSLRLDGRSPVCPYLIFHNGKECIMFKEKPKNKSRGLCSLLKRLSGSI